MTALRAVDVHKAYRRGREQVHALRGVTLEVHPGEVVALLGRSGSGKTTLLNCLLGWETPDSGEVTVPGAAEPGAAPWRTVAVVPQRFGLLDELTLADNVAVPAQLAGIADPGEAALATLGALQLGHLADRLPDEVSLGEQQRTALARALVVRPAFLVADEPTARLDEEMSTRVLATLREVHAAAGTGVLIAGHDPLAVAAADRVVQLSDGVLLG
ncbi:ABC transporter ATP-binding protein [Modestobacter versicolor]|uniref:ABC transporter ATP-binding protein n=1 Tax=Modestobacter versicolor TaxID=429133 RepID=A0A323V5F2_9ACTN|nr:ATP-binding cassette domain-containing protein [Modestobacter versicolor]MBB3675771.1 putative ABC transport system ATP-binding protein [Modestobacter versicolor]PZA19323.1 ABC transporter ATP-binding protein [Modestobacter versicolor]